MKRATAKVEDVRIRDFIHTANNVVVRRVAREENEHGVREFRRFRLNLEANKEIKEIVHDANKDALKKVLNEEEGKEAARSRKRERKRANSDEFYDDGWKGEYEGNQDDPEGWKEENGRMSHPTKTEGKVGRIMGIIRPIIDALYPEDGSKPDPVKAAKVRRELLDCIEKSPKDVQVAVHACLDGVILRAVFDAVSNEVHVRQRACGYFTSVRENGTEIEMDISVAYLCEAVALPKTLDMEAFANEQIAETGKVRKFNTVKMNDGNGRVQMVEFEESVERAARMLMKLQDPRAIDVLFESGSKLREHPLYVELGARLTEIAKFIQENEKKKKEAAKEFKKYVATEPPATFK